MSVPENFQHEASIRYAAMESIAGTTTIALTLALLASVHLFQPSFQFVSAYLLAGVLAFATWRLMCMKTLEYAAITAILAVAVGGIGAVLAPPVGRAAIMATVLAAAGATLFGSIFFAKLVR